MSSDDGVRTRQNGVEGVNFSEKSMSKVNTEPYILESHSNDDAIHNNCLQANYVSQSHEPIVTIFVPNTQDMCPCDVENYTQLSMLSDKKMHDDDDRDNISGDGMSQNEIKERSKMQDKIKCEQYRDKKNKSDTIVNSKIPMHQTLTVEEEEKIKRRREHGRLNSKRYRDRKRASKLITDQSPKTVARHVSKCQHFHHSHNAGPARNVPFTPSIHTGDPHLSTRNEPYMQESYKDYIGIINGDTPSHKPNITIHVPNAQNILPHDIQYNTELKISSDGVKKERQDSEEVDFCHYGMSPNEIEEIKIRKRELNKIRCQRYRAKKKAIVCSQDYKHPTMTVEDEEKIKCRKEYDKQKSKRYRDKKRATNLIYLLSDQPSKTVVTHVSKCQNFNNSYIEPSASNGPGVPQITTNSLTTWNEQYIPESHTDYTDNNHNDTPSQVNNAPQLHEPIITIHVPNTQNILPHNVQMNTEFKISLDGGTRKGQDNYEGAHFFDDCTSHIEKDLIKERRKMQNRIKCQRYRDKKKKTDSTVSLIFKHQPLTVEEEEKIKRRREYDKQKSKRYRDRKRATLYTHILNDMLDIREHRV